MIATHFVTNNGTMFENPLVKLHSTYVDEESWNTAIEDMLGYDSGEILEEDKTFGEILVRSERCTIDRWNSFGFNVHILNLSKCAAWTVSGENSYETE